MLCGYRLANVTNQKTCLTLLGPWAQMCGFNCLCMCWGLGRVASVVQNYRTQLCMRREKCAMHVRGVASVAMQ